MSWADELYDNEPGLAPTFEKGGHIFSLLAKALGLGGALEGNWAGQAEGTHSPMWGTGSGAKTGYFLDTIPFPVPKNEAPMANIIGSAPWPVKGAMEATGFIPRVIDSYKMRNLINQQSPEEYKAIVNSLPGIRQSAGQISKEAYDWIAQKLGGIVPDMSGAMQPARARASVSPKHPVEGKYLQGLTDEQIQKEWGMTREQLLKRDNEQEDLLDTLKWDMGEGPEASPKAEAAYRPLLHRLLGKHDLIFPTVPKSLNEPLIIKTPAGDISPITSQLNPSYEDFGTAQGLHSSLWGRKSDDIFEHRQPQGPINVEGTQHWYGAPPGTPKTLKGDLVASITNGQEEIIPHEFGHVMDAKVTGKEWARPNSQILDAQAKMMWPIRNAPGAPEEWAPFQAEHIKPVGNAFSQAKRDLFYDMNPELQNTMQHAWAGYNAELPGELMSELVNPYAASKRFSALDTHGAGPYGDQLRQKAAEVPILDSFLNLAARSVPEGAYRIPQYNQQALGLAGQGATQSINRIPPEYIDSLFGQGR